MKSIFASKCRTDVLKLLSNKGEMSISLLVRQTNSTWSEVDRNIKLLENRGFVTSRFYKHRRLIKLNKNSEKTVVVLKALRLLEIANLDHFMI